MYVEGTEQDKIVLTKFIKTSDDRRAIARAQAIQWSIEGRDRSDLSGLFHVKTDTISGWFKRWNPNDLSTLSDEPRIGRLPTLTADSQKEAMTSESFIAFTEDFIQHQVINSSELNHIEILWKMIKHQWLDMKDYQSPKTLEDAVVNIIKNFGLKYSITFY